MNKILKIYKSFSLILFNTIIIILLLNFMSWVYLKLTYKDSDTDIIYEVIDYNSYQYGNIKNYTDSSEVVSMIKQYIQFLEKGGQELLYHPATEYQLAPFSLSNLNVVTQENGFNIRHTPSNVKGNIKKEIYCFGGSTTFGPFIKDNETWPYYLQEALDSVKVLNYGVPGFVPTQETNQFIYLLKLGYRPSLCIFMDGVNIGPPYDGSDFTRSIYQKFEENTFKKSYIKLFIAELPLIKLIQNKPLKNSVDIFKTNNIDFAEIGFGSEYNEIIIQRFIQNALLRKQVANLYGVNIIQFLQPNTAYSYPEAFMTSKVKENEKSEYSKRRNKNTKYIYDKILNSGCSYISLTSLFTSYNKPAVIDFMHYSPGFNKYLAENIANNVLVDVNNFSDFEHIDSLATGTKFEINNVK